MAIGLLNSYIASLTCIPASKDCEDNSIPFPGVGRDDKEVVVGEREGIEFITKGNDMEEEDDDDCKIDGTTETLSVEGISIEFLRDDSPLLLFMYVYSEAKDITLVGG